MLRVTGMIAGCAIEMFLLTKIFITNERCEIFVIVDGVCVELEKDL